MLVLVSSSDFGFQPALRIWDVVSMQGTCVLDRNRVGGSFCLYSWTGPQGSCVVFTWGDPKDPWPSGQPHGLGTFGVVIPDFFRHLHGLHVFLADVHCCFKGFSQDAAWKTCIFPARNGDPKRLRSMVSKSQSLFFVQYATNPWNGCGSKRGIHSAHTGNCQFVLIVWPMTMMSSQSHMGWW